MEVGPNTPVPAAAISVRPVSPREGGKIKTASRTPSLTSLLKGETKPEATNGPVAEETPADEPFTETQLRDAWNAYAEQRKKFQAEYQMLSQPFRVEGGVITVDLLSPVHETMLNSIKQDLSTFLREKLRNNTIQVTGQLQSLEDQKIIYTNREKFDFLAEKNPMLRELKDRLGLDTDF